MQPHGSEREQPVVLTTGPIRLEGILGLPEKAGGVVLFAHGSGSGRRSPRNTFVARTLQAGGLATLLLDLLDEQEAEDRRKVFDIDLLAERLLVATNWLANAEATRGFGSAISVPAPGRGQPRRLQPADRARWQRWSLVAGGRTWPRRSWRR